MKRLIAYVSGNVQKVGYRAKVIDIARAFGIKGTIENLSDGRAKIIAEGDDEKLKWFESAIDIKNTLIQVSSIERRYTQADGEFSGFNKIVEKGETDSRLDKGIEIMAKMLVAIDNVNRTLIDMNSNLGSKIDRVGAKVDHVGDKVDQVGAKVDHVGDKVDQVGAKVDQVGAKVDQVGAKVDQIGDKMDKSLVKQDRMLEKQDELLVEVKDMNRGLNDKIDKVLDKSDIAELKADVSEVKAALRAKGII